MKRSRLKNKANKTKTSIDISNFKKQRNYVVNLNKQAKFEYFSSYNSADSKLFWVNFKPYFSNKYSKADTDIVLNENGDLILKNEEIVKNFNDYFGAIVDKLQSSPKMFWKNLYTYNVRYFVCTFIRLDRFALQLRFLS